MQEGITITVMDAPLRFPQRDPMVNHDEIRSELRRQLDAEMLKVKDVAAKLGIAPTRVTEIRYGRRRIQPNEMHVLAKMLGLEGDSPATQTRITRTVQIPHWGKVAQGLWREETLADPERAETIGYDMRPGDPGPQDLFAVTPEGASMNLVFPPGVQLICRRVPFGLQELKAGDLVVVERNAHDLRELTCKRLVIDAEGVFWLKAESDQAQFQSPWRIGKPDEDHHSDDGIQVVGKVIRGVIDYE